MENSKEIVVVDDHGVLAPAARDLSEENMDAAAENLLPIRDPRTLLPILKTGTIA